MINHNLQNNALNVYIVPSINGEFGRASGIPGNAMVVSHSYFLNSVNSHEIGHLLGLYHTHSGRGCNDFANCSEDVNGNNCNSCGDLVCDTPTDPCLSGIIDNSCNYIGSTTFSPDIENIMSYTRPNCMEHFTYGQFLRMQTIIDNSCMLQAMINYPITGPSLVCTSNNTFTLSNVPAGASVSWSRSGNLSLVSSNNNNITVKATNSSTNGSGWVSAIITTNCGSFPVQRGFWVGNPPADNTTLIWSGTRGVNPIRTRPGSTYIFRVDQVPQTSSYTWVLPAGFTVSGGNTTTTGTSIYIITSDINGTYTLYCRANNACGSSWTNSLTINNGSSSGGPNPLRVYPNPASESLIIEDDITELESMGNDPAKEVFTVKLVDNKGTNRRTGTSVNGRINISTHDLPDGLYILQIETKQGIEHRQILIKH